MGIRDRINNHPRIMLGAVIAFLIATTLLLASERPGRIGASANQAFYTVDDGSTWFADDAGLFPPFNHDGKDAVWAHVVNCNGKQSVGYLERFTPARQKLAAATVLALKEGKPLPKPPIVSGPSANWGSEIKKPGDAKWLAAGDLAKAAKVLQSQCSDGSDPQPVSP